MPHLRPISSKAAASVPDNRGRRRAPTGGRLGFSAVDAVEDQFTVLCGRVPPLSVDGAATGWGLPARPIPVGELGSVLLHPATGARARDAALTALIGPVLTAHRTTGPTAADTGKSPVGERADRQLALLGLLLPGLRHAAGRLLAAYPHADDQDLLAELVTGVLAALPGFDPGPGRVAGRLLAQGVLAARRYGRAQPEHDRLPDDDGSAAFGAPRAGLRHGAGGWPHAEPAPVQELTLGQLLGAAARAGIISAADGELIAATRLCGQRMAEYAAVRGLPYPTVRRRRVRAERRLAPWLAGRAAGD